MNEKELNRKRIKRAHLCIIHPYILWQKGKHTIAVAMKNE